MTNAYILLKSGSISISERKLGNHTAGTLLSSSLTSSNYSKSGNIGTMKVARKLAGLNSNYYSFSDNGGTIVLIWAYGGTSAFAKHNGSSRGSTTISLTSDCIPTTTTIDTAVCRSFKSPSGKYTWTSPKTYYDTLKGVNCDSIIKVNLTIFRTSATIDTVTCGSYISPSKTKTWTKSGQYFEIIKNSVNCDSVLTINLTVNNPTDTTLTISTCKDYTSPSGNYTWTSSGKYFDTIPNSNNCDSTITVNLTVNDSTHSSITAKTCDSYPSPSGKYTWRLTDTYIDTIPNAVGCDSIITANLTIFNDSVTRATSTISETVCNTYTSPSGRYTWTNSNTYLDTVSSNAGCDSFITINLTVKNKSTSSITEEVCDSYNSPSGKYVWTVSDIYTDTIPNSVNCDSIITIDLTVHSNDTSLTNKAPTLIANTDFLTYQWLDCNDNYSVIKDSTKKSFTASLDGSYAVELTNNNCVDTSSCMLVANVSITENTFGNQLVLFPNPTKGNLTISLGDKYDEITIKIKDVSGKQLKVIKFNEREAFPIEITGPKGIYLVSIETHDDKKATIRVLKE